MISVSIVTVTQYSRLPFLKVLSKCIKNQTYPFIIEWLILDTTHDLEYEVKKLKPGCKISYYKSTKTTLGGWRNETNDLSVGEIIVCMDDDEYYVPKRVAHAVEMLKSKKSLIAGCDKMFFYDIHYKKFYQYKGFSPYHSTNNCLAYWRDYLKNHLYDESKTCTEENSFTNDFKEPMIQLNPNKTVLQFSHDENTYNKKQIIYQNFFLPDDKKYIIEQTTPIKNFIGNKQIFREYDQIFKNKLVPKECPYDIVYFTGGYSILWSPKQQDLGGSEQAVKYLTEEWAKKGKKVIVYGNLSYEGLHEGVEYSKHINFHFWNKFNTLILWRTFGMYPFLEFNLNVNKLFIDMHDHSPDAYPLLTKYESKISNIMVKSEFQKVLIEKFSGHQFQNFKIIPNGLRISNFTQEINEPRNPFRFCYASCYTRGLERILRSIWPKMYELDPRIEFHVYYGMTNVQDEKFKTEMSKLLSQPGVFDHGRQPVEVINQEKHLSTFHFYYTDTPTEIDCISIRESIVAGCIPLISNVNVFGCRSGIHIKWLADTEESNTTIATELIELMKQDLTEIRQELLKCHTLVDWENVANQWLQEVLLS